MHGNKPSKKKVLYTPTKRLLQYLEQYGRLVTLPLQYDDMVRYMASTPLLDSTGKDTLWETVFYDHSETKEIHHALCEIYALLKTEGDLEVIVRSLAF